MAAPLAAAAAPGAGALGAPRAGWHTHPALLMMTTIAVICMPRFLQTCTQYPACSRVTGL
jgi:hypothetical protein